MMTQQSDGSGEWGPWIRHDGRGCPVAVGTLVEVVCEDRFGFAMREIARVSGGEYSSWNWTHYPELKRILRYRERKPLAMRMLESQLLVQKLPSGPVRVDS